MEAIFAIFGKLGIMENPTVEEYFNYMQYLHYLPPEVFNKIFGYLSPKFVQEIKFVCSNWKYMLDKIQTADINNEYYQRTNKLKVFIFVKIRNLTNEVQGNLISVYKIRRMEFWDVVVSYNLIHFLEECSFVQELKFANVTLESRRKIKCPHGLSLPKVKIMTLILKWNVEPTVSELILIDFLRQVKFGQLEEVHICSSVQWAFHGLVEMYLAITDPLPKIVLPSGIKSTGFLEFLIENCQSIKKLVVGGQDLHPFGSPIEELANQLDQLQFEEMKCSIHQAGKFSGKESLIIGGQRSLKKLDIHVFYNCWPALAKVIASSCSCLHEVKINTTLDDDALHEFQSHGLDASVFKDCSELKSLYLINYTRIFNLTSLPDSIQSLSLDHLAVSTQEDILAIASKLCNLREFNLGAYHASTINVEIIQAFTRNKTLERLCIVECSAEEADTDSVSDFAKSQHEFQIDLRFIHFWTLTIYKK